ncbi:hypothetical protein HanRHA438_Chr09g0409411 [Helianthus annuus]|nr:hypothetical protein HanRHA438_Chr09g0409411 [Helianthus annuus]
MELMCVRDGFSQLMDHGSSNAAWIKDPQFSLNKGSSENVAGIRIQDPHYYPNTNNCFHHFLNLFCRSIRIGLGLTEILGEYAS